MASKKKKKDPQPKVPNYQNIDTASLKQPTEAARPEYEPMSLNDFSNWMNKAYQLQLQYAPAVTETQRQAQSTLFNNMAALQQAQAPNYAATASNLMNQYDPEFLQNYRQLGSKVMGDLATAGQPGTDMEKLINQNVYSDLQAGRDLGPGLSGEIEQSIRGAQLARGNWLGPAPTAQEAFGKGQAAEALYQQRLSSASGWSAQLENQRNARVGQSQNYLQGRNPMDMMGQTAGAFMGQSYYPNQSYVDTSLGVNAMNVAQSGQSAFNSTVSSNYATYQSALQDYNRNYIGATSANNESMFGQYDRTADAWMYREAVRNGLYSTPSMGGGGGMGGIGSAMGGISSGLMGLAGAGISAGVLTGGGAAAAGIGAAASAAAAAICWLARKLLPDKWKAFRKWLFTEASPELRRKYTFNARRIANALP
jgi:hypothetical protein